jgi:tight adherence protein C
MSPIASAVVSFLLVASVTVVIAFLLLRIWPAVSRERLRPSTSPAGEASILRWDETTGWTRFAERVGRRALGSDARPSKYRQRLAWAGYHSPESVLVFVGAKVILALAAGASYFVYGLLVQRLLPGVLQMSLVLAVLGFFLPDFWLRNRIKARQREVVNALPDILDLLMVCVEAGLGFDAAIARVAEEPENRKSPLHQELLRMHLEIRAGRPRQEALRALGERTGVEEVKAMVGAFIQTERLGTPLGKTLRIHADSARVQRRHRAEERAHLAPLKMLFPTVVFLMPSFFLVTMAPSLLSLLRVLKAISGR